MSEIYAKLVRVGSEEDLETGEAKFRLGFRLPTGDIVYTDASAEVVLRLKNHTNEGRPPSRPAASVPAQPTAAPAPAAVPPPTRILNAVRRPPEDEDDYGPDGPPLPEGLEPAPEVEEYGGGVPQEPEEELDLGAEATWRELPEDILPEHVKVAMDAMRMGDQALPDTLVVAQVVSIRDGILDEYTADDWARLGYDVSGAEQQPTAQVQWDEGQPIQPRLVPQRRLTRVDEKGNPIVKPNPNDVDPGEIAAADDEDGTDQF